MSLLDLQVFEGVEQARSLKMTVLFKSKGSWSSREAQKLIEGLGTEVCLHDEYPQHLILLHHYLKKTTQKILGNSVDHRVTSVIGIKNTNLPFTPKFKQ